MYIRRRRDFSVRMPVCLLLIAQLFFFFFTDDHFFFFSCNDIVTREETHRDPSVVRVCRVSGVASRVHIPPRSADTRAYCRVGGVDDGPGEQSALLKKIRLGISFQLGKLQ